MYSGLTVFINKSHLSQIVVFDHFEYLITEGKIPRSLLR